MAAVNSVPLTVTGSDAVAAFGGGRNERAAHGEDRRGGPFELTGALRGGAAVAHRDGRGLGDGAGGVERQFGGRDERRGLRHVVEIGDAGAGEVLSDHPDGHRRVGDFSVGNGRAGHRQHGRIGRNWRGAPATAGIARRRRRQRLRQVRTTRRMTMHEQSHGSVPSFKWQEWWRRRRTFRHVHLAQIIDPVAAMPLPG